MPQVDQTDPGAFERAVTPQTRLILLESPGNPLLQITDLRSIAAIARAHGVATARRWPKRSARI